VTVSALFFILVSDLFGIFFDSRDFLCYNHPHPSAATLYQMILDEKT